MKRIRNHRGQFCTAKAWFDENTICDTKRFTFPTETRDFTKAERQLDQMKQFWVDRKETIEIAIACAHTVSVSQDGPLSVILTESGTVTIEGLNYGVAAATNPSQAATDFWTAVASVVFRQESHVKKALATTY